MEAKRTTNGAHVVGTTGAYHAPNIQNTITTKFMDYENLKKMMDILGKAHVMQIGDGFPTLNFNVDLYHSELRPDTNLLTVKYTVEDEVYTDCYSAEEISRAEVCGEGIKIPKLDSNGVASEFIRLYEWAGEDWGLLPLRALKPDNGGVPTQVPGENDIEVITEAKTEEVIGLGEESEEETQVTEINRPPVTPSKEVRDLSKHSEPEDISESLFQAAKPLMTWLDTNGHLHSWVTVDANSAELCEGVKKVLRYSCK